MMASKAGKLSFISRRKFPNRQNGVVSAKTKGVVQTNLDALRSRHVRHIIEIAIRVWCFIIDGRGNDLVTYGQNAKDGFNGSRSAHNVPGHGFCGTDGHIVSRRAKDAFDGRGFRGIVQLGGRAVSADVIDIGGLEVGGGPIVTILSSLTGIPAVFIRKQAKTYGTCRLLADADKVQCYASIKTVQKLLGRPSTYFTDINVKLHDILDAPAMAQELSARFGVDAIDIQTANAQFETGSNVRSIISYAVGVVLLIVAGFGIYNILNMMIYEKLDSIAILKATGFSGGDVRVIFINLSMIIGAFGAAGGLLLGGLLAVGIDRIPFHFDALPTMTTYPVDHNLKYYLIGVAFALVTTFIAGLFPARKASRVDPVEIIRGK